MAKTFQAAISKKTGRTYRTTGKSEERGRYYRHDQSGIGEQVELNFAPLA